MPKKIKDFSKIRNSMTPFVRFTIYAPIPPKTWVEMEIEVSYAPACRPVARLKIGEEWNSNFAQVGRLISGLCGKKVAAIRLSSASGAEYAYFKIVFDGESYSVFD